MFVNNVPDIRQCSIIICNKLSRVRQHQERLRHAVFALCCEKGFVVTTIGKVVNMFISTLYVTVMGETDTVKAKCKAVRNRAFS